MNIRASNPSKVIQDDLPDDFFDVQAKSKKVQEDDLAKELEQFEREMAALEAESEEQLKEEFNKLQEDKNIEELDQQLEQWKRIVELEKRAEQLQNKTQSERITKKMKLDSDKSLNATRQLKPRVAELSDEEDDLSNIEDFEDKLFDWRSKGI